MKLNTRFVLLIKRSLERSQDFLRGSREETADKTEETSEMPVGLNYLGRECMYSISFLLQVTHPYRRISTKTKADIRNVDKKQMNTWNKHTSGE